MLLHRNFTYYIDKKNVRLTEHPGREILFPDGFP